MAGTAKFKGTISTVNKKYNNGRISPVHLFFRLDRNICRQIIAMNKTLRKINLMLKLLQLFTICKRILCCPPCKIGTYDSQFNGFSISRKNVQKVSLKFCFLLWGLENTIRTNAIIKQRKIYSSAPSKTAKKASIVSYTPLPIRYYFLLLNCQKDIPLIKSGKRTRP